MNPLEIYKRLPRTNCGECPAKTCMAFAVKLSKKEHSTSECPKLNENVKKEIDAVLSNVTDWKEKRVEELFNEILSLNFSGIAEGMGAVGGGDWLKIKYMGREVTVSHSNFKDEINIWDKLLILMYIKNSGNRPLRNSVSIPKCRDDESQRLSGKWVAFRDLKDGSLKSIGFRESCEVPLAKIFGTNRGDFLNRLITIGAKKVEGFSTEHSFVIYPLPKIPFLLLLWPGDEDFKPACNVLLDSTATEFLDVEALMYLGQALVRTLKEN